MVKIKTIQNIQQVLSAAQKGNTIKNLEIDLGKGQKIICNILVTRRIKKFSEIPNFEEENKYPGFGCLNLDQEIQDKTIEDVKRNFFKEVKI